MARPEDADFELIERGVGRLFRQGRNPRFSDAIRERAGIKLDRATYGVLARLAELAPARLSDVAAQIGVDVSTVSRQVQSLEQKGLIDRRPDPADGRAVRLDLTRTGRAVLAKLKAAWQETVAELLVDWEPADIRRFATLLDRFADDLVAFGGDDAHGDAPRRVTGRTT
jgi:DNA-binding MarR family transcriptional regulator